MEDQVTMGMFKAFLKGIPITIGVAGAMLALGDYRASDRATVESLEHHMTTLQAGLDQNVKTTQELTNQLGKLIQRIDDKDENQTQFRTRIR